MTRRLLLLISTLTLLSLPFAKAQDVVSDSLQHPTTSDTVTEKRPVTPRMETGRQRKPHNAKTATIMSACLPGLGQVYNGKWWKVPIVYAGLGGLGYMSFSNHHEYRSFLNAFKFKNDPNLQLSEYEQSLADKYGASQLQTYKEKYQHDFELFTILSVAWYALNIVDACVDGHLYNYDINDDLSFSIDPMLPTHVFAAPMTAQAGLTFKFTFDK